MASNTLHRKKQFFGEIWRTLVIQKRILQDEESELGITLTKVDIFLMCLGVVSTSFYQEMPVMINIYGYMTFFPLLISGIVAYITSMSYAELVSLNANSGGSYRYVYYTLGEFMAFLVGWNVILISSIRLIHSTSYLMKMIDTPFLGGVLSNFTRNHYHIGGMKNFFVYVYPNAHLETLITTILLTVISVFAVKYGKIMVNISSIVNIIILFTCLSIFWFCMDLSKFNIIGGTKDFSFFSKGSVQGHIFYMDIEVAIYAGAEAVKPNLTIPAGLVGSFKWGFIIYLASILLYSMREGAFNLDNFNPMQTALSKLGFETFHKVPTIGLCLCYIISFVARMFIGSRVIYCMAKDGMLFPIFEKVNNKLKNPLNAILVVAIIPGLLAIFISGSFATSQAMIGMQIIVQILTLLSLLVTRYKCELRMDAFDPGNRWLLINYPKPIEFPTKKTQVISMYLIYLAVLATAFTQIILVVYLIKLDFKFVSLKIAFIFSLFITIFITIILNLQPQNDRRKLYSAVRGVPFTPIIAIAWNILVLIFLPETVWIKISCFWIIGIIFYFSYVFMRSKEFIERKEERATE